MSLHPHLVASIYIFCPLQVSVIRDMVSACFGVRYVMDISTAARMISNIHEGRPNTLYGTSASALTKAITFLQE